ncbi:ribonuclease P protein subunit p21 isoform X1 [Choloepus didactylus]|uniref:ribonuclease P protein subunit p21 isoform X1 n=1 Tax=Choloepus didactylus TaxID=27675 RepID=UPI00189C74CD|nr:ribonuclease P protein subunit p21 isoform X1 [Choloepus didactylus]
MGLSDRQQHQGPRRLLRRSVVRGLRDYASQEALRSAPECPGGGASQGAGSAGVARMAGPVKDREAFQRLNFLYQAAHCVLAQDPENQALARFYCHTEKIIAKRLVLRRDPSVKRTLCRGCSSLLIPGLTCTQRQRRRRGQCWTVQTCLTCQRSQRFLNDPTHLLWGDRLEAQLGSQADPKPPQPLPNTAHPSLAHHPEKKVQPQSVNHQ